MVRRAIASVLRQDVGGIEIIAVDGGSIDGTQEVIRSYADVRLLHAPKSTIYEALNIAIKAARAPVIGHLNSDDRILPGALRQVIAAQKRGVDIVRGRATFTVHGSGATPQVMRVYGDRVVRRLEPGALLFQVPAINACFITASAYRRIGPYEEQFLIAADREWLLRAVLSGVSVLTIDFPVYEYLIHPNSTTISTARANEVEIAREHLLIAERYLAGHYMVPCRALCTLGTPTKWSGCLRPAASAVTRYPMSRMRSDLARLACSCGGTGLT